MFDDGDKVFGVSVSQLIKDDIRGRRGALRSGAVAGSSTGGLAVITSAVCAAGIPVVLLLVVVAVVFFFIGRKVGRDSRSVPRPADIKPAP
jgi:hypothetical protein